MWWKPRRSGRGGFHGKLDIYPVIKELQTQQGDSDSAANLIQMRWGSFALMATATPTNTGGEEFRA